MDLCVHVERKYSVLCHSFIFSVYRRNLLSEDSLARQREISKEEKKLKAIKQKVTVLQSCFLIVNVGRFANGRFANVSSQFANVINIYDV